jgi:hypothetical protein
MVTVKNTGLPINEVEAYTRVDSSRCEPEAMLCRFQRESPRILTALDSEVRDTTTSAIDTPASLLFVMANDKSWTLPAVIWIDWGWVDDEFVLVLLTSFSLAVLLLEDWPKLVRVSGDSEDSGTLCKDDELVGKTFKPDWGDSGYIWIPRTWFEVLLFPYASLYDSCMFKVVSAPAAVSAGKIVGTISFFSFASIRPMLNVGKPTITIVGGEDDDDSGCCVSVDVVPPALLLLLIPLPLLLPSPTLW